jgi:hypothetical protein
MMHSIGLREREVSKTLELEDRNALQRHLDEIIAGEAFRGSHRSQRFLRYIVEQAISGRIELLKERVIGAELFGRSPSYDTGQDAIVRVAASDVRKRLQQHYHNSRWASEFRIQLPQGSYIPEIHRDSQAAAPSSDCEKVEDALPSVLSTPSQDVDSQLPSLKAEGEFGASLKTGRGAARWRIIAGFLLVLVTVLTVLDLAQMRTEQKVSGSRIEHPSILGPPWSVLFNSPNATHVITSDVDIVRIQKLIGNRITLSDYANRNYLPRNNELSTEDKSYLLQGDKSATLDSQITASIAELAGTVSRKIDVKGARDVRFSDLKTDDNFIFLGSPFSNPWFTVFNDQLDFQFIVGGNRGLGPEAIRNVHPGLNEKSVYVSTANGGATGESYAIVALVVNPGQYGHVLLLAGISGEGTQAAGRLVTDVSRLSVALKKCGISPAPPLKHFEMLLGVNLMAGSPGEFDVVACHVLPESNSPL